MSINTPIYRGKAQSDLDMAGFNLLNWSGGSGGPNVLITLNVKDAPYSAVGDGVADDTVAIQGAINAVSAAGGGVVFFPAGTYLCNGAFDARTNSVLSFPYKVVAGAITTTIELCGQAAASVSGNRTVIKSTKTGTGTAPAILAAHTFWGRTLITDWAGTLSNVQVVIRNLMFVASSDPTLYGVQLSTAVDAILEDVTVETTDFTVSPTHGTVGLWMPDTQNFGVNYLNRVWVAGYDTGLVASCEHFRCPQANFLNCHTAAEILGGQQLGWGNFMVDHCNTAIKFTSLGAPADLAPILINLDIEQMNSGWQVPAAGGDILDSSNVGRGVIRHYCGRLGVGHNTIGVTGGANLQFIDTFNPLGVSTVALLPSSPKPGQIATVTDGTASLAWGATVTGGASTKYLVFYNGTNWTVAGK